MDSNKEWKDCCVVRADPALAFALVLLSAGKWINEP
jgi:hypothetical protein